MVCDMISAVNRFLEADDSPRYDSDAARWRRFCASIPQSEIPSAVAFGAKAASIAHRAASASPAAFRTMADVVDDLPSEKALRITMDAVEALTYGEPPFVKVVTLIDWLVMDDAVEAEMKSEAMQIYNEMVRNGEIVNGRVTDKGLRRLDSY
jgi:hypothetical protein